MKIFIIHYKKLVERKKYLTSVLSEFDYEFIEEFDRESISNFDTSLYSNKPELWKERVEKIYKDEPGYRILRDSEICNSLSHLKALKNIIDNNLEFAIVLEDDVILQNDFKKKIEEIVNNIPKDFDFAFFGNSYTMNMLDDITSDGSTNITGNLWKKKLGITRTVDAYVVSNKAAKILVDNINEIVLPFDFELTYFFRKLKMNIYWYDPGFIRQGSQTGKYKSSIR